MVFHGRNTLHESGNYAKLPLSGVRLLTRLSAHPPTSEQNMSAPTLRWSPAAGGSAVRRARGEAGVRARPLPGGHQHHGPAPRFAQRRQQREWTDAILEPPRQHPAGSRAVPVPDLEAGEHRCLRLAHAAHVRLPDLELQPRLVQDRTISTRTAGPSANRRGTRGSLQPAHFQLRNFQQRI